MTHENCRTAVFLTIVLLASHAAVRADDDKTEAEVVRRVEALFGDIVRDDKRPGRPIVEVKIYSLDTTDADVEAVAKLKHLTRLFLCRGEMTPACVQRLENLQDLKDLTLSTPPLTDATMKSVAKLSKLEKLSIWGVQLFNKGTEEHLTDAGLRELAPLKNLRSLGLSTPGRLKITGAGLSDLPHLRHSLKELALDEVDAAGLKAIGQLAALESLELDAPKAAIDFKQFAALANLRSLNLRWAEASDSNWRELRFLGSLEKLEFRDSEIGDVGVESIGHLKKLKKLKIDRVKFRSAGLTHLARLGELHSLEIHFETLPLALPDVPWLPRGLKSLEVRFPTNANGGTVAPPFSGDRVIAEIGKLSDLSWLVLAGVPLDGPGFESLANLKKLQTLELGRLDDTVLQATAKANVLHLLANFHGQKAENGMSKRPAGPDNVVAVDLSHFHENVDRIGDAGLKALTRFKNLKELYLQRSKVTDTGLRQLAAFPNLESLQLEDSDVTLAGVKEFGQLKKLKLFSLRGSKATDDGLKELAGLKSLQWLTLVDTNISSKGIEHLAGLPKLNLEFDASQLTDDMLRVLKRTGFLHRLTGHPVGQLWGMHSRSINGMFEAPPTVKMLNLSGAPLTDAGLRELSALTSLTDLNLDGTGVTDAGLKDLANFKDLKRLNLSYTTITDAGLEHLAKLPNLTALDLTKTKTTTSARERLMKRLPSLKISKSLES